MMSRSLKIWFLGLGILAACGGSEKADGNSQFLVVAKKEEVATKLRGCQDVKPLPAQEGSDEEYFYCAPTPPTDGQCPAGQALTCAGSAQRDGDNTDVQESCFCMIVVDDCAGSVDGGEPVESVGEYTAPANSCPEGSGARCNESTDDHDQVVEIPDHAAPIPGCILPPAGAPEEGQSQEAPAGSR